MSFDRGIKLIQENNQFNVETLIVTKNQQINDVKFYYDNNYKLFGENKIQEIIKKKDIFVDATFHFIGRIQTNKMKSIVEHCDLIHSVSEIRYLNLIDKHAHDNNKIQKILIQFNISLEKTKSGFDHNDAEQIFIEALKYQNIKVVGIMLMGDHCTDKTRIKKTFMKGCEVYDRYKSKYDLSVLSMGMSDDYQLAIDSGATIVRLGSILFNKKDQK